MERDGGNRRKETKLYLEIMHPFLRRTHKQLVHMDPPDTGNGVVFIYWLIKNSKGGE